VVLLGVDHEHWLDKYDMGLVDVSLYLIFDFNFFVFGICLHVQLHLNWLILVFRVVKFEVDFKVFFAFLDFVL
jgi:hypothetical protein